MPTFLRGAKPSPRHKLLAAVPHLPAAPPPPQFAVVPKQLSVWLNDQIGDCVSAEEAYAKAHWSVQCGLPELFVPDNVLSSWVYGHGYANGAMLTDVMDSMIRDGITVGGTNYKDGPYSAVDYSDETVLQSALTVGPVKIAIDADALPGGAGNGNGWHATGGRPGQYGNTDHCVGITGYGPAGWLYSQLGVPLPAGVDANKSGYLLFTWGSIGFVDHAWIMSTCTEAWVRNPTTPGQAPAPAPVPPVPPSPAPVGPVWRVILEFLAWLKSLLHLSAVGHPLPPAANGAAIDPALIWLVIDNLAKLAPVIVADIQAGKTFYQILLDCLAVVVPPAGK